MSYHDLKLIETLPAAPAAQRAIPVRLDSFENTIAYGSGNCVIIRPARGGQVWLCSLHKAPVTAVRFSPNGAFIASGDQNGCLVIFANKESVLEKYSAPVLQGAVRDIAWTADGERLLVVGEGKTCFGVAITNTGNSIGAINGHARTILSCDLRSERPFRAFTGSADSFVGLYEGVPYAFKTNIPGHRNTVTCVRYCAATDEVATVSSSAEVIVLDGKTGEKKRSLPTTHSGTIYSLAWSPDGSAIATASADKHVHILDAATGAERHKVSLGDAVSDMQQGVAWTRSAGVVAVSLRGTVVVIDEKTGKVVSVVHGHQGRVLCLHACEGSSDLLSVSAEGKLIRWSAGADLPGGGGQGGVTNRLVAVPASCDVVTAAVATNKTLYVVAGKEVLTYPTDGCGSGSTDGATVLSSTAGGFATSLAVTGRGEIVLAFRTKLVVLDANGNVCAEVALPPQFNASVVAASGCVVAVGGDRAVRLFSIEAGGQPKALAVTFDGHHTGAVSAVAFSKDGTRVASADGTSRNIFVWSASTGEVEVNYPMSYHHSTVVAMTFGATRDALLSGGLDCTLIAWSLASNKRRMEDATHRGGVTAIAWGPQDSVYSAGGDCCIKRWAA